MFWSPVVTNRVVGVLRAWLTGTDPTNSPEPAGTSERVNVLIGCRAVTTPVLKGRESLLEAASTCTVPALARLGSLTVTVSASLHSYRLVRSTDSVAHCCPAGWPARPNLWQAGVCGGRKAPSSTG